MAGLDETKKPNPLQSDQTDQTGTDTGSNKPAPGISALDAFSGTPQANQFGLGSVGSGRLAGPASAADMSALGFAKAGSQQIIDFVAKDKKLETGIGAVDFVGNTGLGFINTTLKMNSAAVELIAVPSKLSTTVEGLKHLPSAVPALLAETGNNLWNGDWATRGQTTGNIASLVVMTFGAAGGPKSATAVEGTAARTTSLMSRLTNGARNWWYGADELAAASSDDLIAAAMKTPRGGPVVELPGGATRPLTTELPVPVMRPKVEVAPVAPQTPVGTVVRDVSEITPRLSRLSDDLGAVGLVGDDVAALQRQLTAFAKGEIGGGALESTLQGLRSKVASGSAGAFDDLVNKAVKDLGDVRAASLAAKTNPAAVVNDAATSTTRITAKVAETSTDAATAFRQAESAAAKAGQAEVAVLRNTFEDVINGKAAVSKLDDAAAAVRSKLPAEDIAAFETQMARARQAAQTAQEARGALQTLDNAAPAINKPFRVSEVAPAPVGGSVESATATVSKTSTEAASSLRNVESAAAKAGQSEVAALRNAFEDVINGKAAVSKLDEAAAAVRSKLPVEDIAAFETQMARARQAAQTAQEARGALQTLDNAAPAINKPFRVSEVAPAPVGGSVESATATVSKTSTEAASSLRNVESAAAKAGQAEVAVLRNTFEDVINGKAAVSKLDEAAAAVRSKLPVEDVAAFETQMARARQAAQTAQEARGALQALDNAAPAINKPFRVSEVAPAPVGGSVESATATVSKTSTEAASSLRNVESAAARAGQSEVAALRNAFEDVINGKAAVSKLDDAAAAVRSKLPAEDIAAFETQMARARQAAQTAQEARGVLQTLDNAAPAINKPFRVSEVAPAPVGGSVESATATVSKTSTEAASSLRNVESAAARAGQSEVAALRNAFEDVINGKAAVSKLDDAAAAVRSKLPAEDIAAFETQMARARQAAQTAQEARGALQALDNAAPAINKPFRLADEPIAAAPKGHVGDAVVPPKDAPTTVQARQSFTTSSGSLSDDLATVPGRASTKAQKALDEFAGLTNPTVRDVAALERALKKVSDLSPETALKVERAVADARTIAAATATERAAALTGRIAGEGGVATSATARGGTTAAAATDAGAATLNAAGKTTDAAAAAAVRTAQLESKLASAWETFHNTAVPNLVQTLKAPLQRIGSAGDELAAQVSKIEELAKKAGTHDVTGATWASKLSDAQFMGAVRDRLAVYRSSVAGTATRAELEAIDHALAQLENAQRALSGARFNVASDMGILERISRSLTDHPFYNAWRANLVVSGLLRLGDIGNNYEDKQAAKNNANGGTASGSAAGASAAAGAVIGTKPDDAKPDSVKDKPDDVDGLPNQPPVPGGKGQDTGNQGNQGTGEKVETLPRQTGDNAPVERTSMTQPPAGDQVKTTQISHSGEPTIVAGGPFRLSPAEPLDNYSELIRRNAQRFGLSTPFAPRGYVAVPVEEARVVMPFANRAKFAGIETGSADFAKTSYTPFVAAGKSLLSLDAVRVMSANPAMAVGTDSKGRTLLTPTSTDPISALNARGLVFATAGLGGEGKLIDPKQREAVHKVNTDRRTRGGGSVSGQQGIQFTAVAAPPGAQLTTGTGTNDPSSSAKNDEDKNGASQTTTVAQTNAGDPDDSGINLTTV